MKQHRLSVFTFFQCEKKRLKRLVELKEVLQQNMNHCFCRGDVRQLFSSIEKSQLDVGATLLDSRFLKIGIFSLGVADQAKLLLVQWVAAAWSEAIKSKSQEGKNLFWKYDMKKPLPLWEPAYDVFVLRFRPKETAVFDCLINTLRPRSIALESCWRAQTERPV